MRGQAGGVAAAPGAIDVAAFGASVLPLDASKIYRQMAGRLHYGFSVSGSQQHYVLTLRPRRGNGPAGRQRGRRQGDDTAKPVLAGGVADSGA